jgi:hypothetical protein
MSKGAICNEDSRASANTEGNHGAKLGMEGSKDWLYLEGGHADP